MKRTMTSLAAVGALSLAGVLVPATSSSAESRTINASCPAGYHIRAYSSGGWNGQTHEYTNINGTGDYRTEFSVSQAFVSPRGEHYRSATIVLSNNAGIGGNIPDDFVSWWSCNSDNTPW